MIITENEFVFPPVGYLPIDVWSDQPPFREEVIDGLGIENRVRISRVAQ